MLHWSAESPLRTLLLLASAAVVVYFAFAMAQRGAQLYGMREERVQLQRELAALEVRQQRLLAEKERLTKNQDIESLARQELNLIKPGETAVIVYPAFAKDPPAPEPGAPQGSPAPEDGRPWWQRLFFR